MTQPAGAQPSPSLFFETMNAYQRTEALKAALELDLFTAVAQGADGPERLAKRCSASERGMRILCDFLVVAGFLTKSSGRYGLTLDSSVFLDRRSPAYMGHAVGFLASPLLTEGFKHLVTAVRGGPAAEQTRALLSPEHPVWVEFAHAMPPLMVLPAELVAAQLRAAAGEPWKVLDVAAGHGLFGITLARHNPAAQIVAVDWPAVLEVARENARRAGVAERYSTIPGDAFEVPFGAGYDLALVTNFLHGFSLEECTKLLAKVHAALKPGGQVVVVDYVPDEDRVSPPVAAAFGLMMLANTPGGDVYTASELAEMFRKAGFGASELRDLQPTLQHVALARK